MFLTPDGVARPPRRGPAGQSSSFGITLIKTAPGPPRGRPFLGRRHSSYFWGWGISSHFCNHYLTYVTMQTAKSLFFIFFKKRKKIECYTRAAVIPITPDWMMTATAMITPPISSATATLPFLISSNSSTPFVSLSRMFSAR